MSQICILTDGAAQFPATFGQADRVHVLPFHLRLNGKPPVDDWSLQPLELPVSLKKGCGIQTEAPSIEDFRQAFLELGKKWDEIVVVLASAQLSSSFAHAQAAASGVHTSTAIHLIDSKNISVGLGLLVEGAFEMASTGIHGAEISRQVRGLIPHIYSMFCTQSLTYLACSGYIDPAQAIVGELLNMTPIFVLENGRFTPVQKARNPRHIGDTFHEFVCEFEHVKHAALIQGAVPFAQEVRALRASLHWALRPIQVYEYALNTLTAMILGPRSLGIVVLDHP